MSNRTDRYSNADNLHFAHCKYVKYSGRKMSKVKKKITFFPLSKFHPFYRSEYFDELTVREIVECKFKNAKSELKFVLLVFQKEKKKSMSIGDLL